VQAKPAIGNGVNESVPNQFRFGADSIKLHMQLYKKCLFKHDSFKAVHENAMFHMGANSA
jgi:hypothetical protein